TDYTKLPKVELHLHLDCSLSYEVVQKLNPTISLEEYKANFIAPNKCIDLADYIARAIRGVELMQRKEALRLVTLDLFEQLKADQVIYAEIRFAPLLHTEQGLSPEAVVQTVHEAMLEGIAATGVEAGLILCTLRHFTEAQSMETVKLVEQFQGTSVVGFDLAADEAGFPIDQHIKAFQYAKEKGINRIAHAGEAKGAESVWETLKNFDPSRIGHGVRSIEDPTLMEFLKAQNIHLEVCPTSNIQVGVFDTIENHSLNTIYESGISMSIHTDARTISNVTLADEYALLDRIFNWTSDQCLMCNIEAIEHAFLKAEHKKMLRAKLLKGYNIV
ncbi:MAG: adenosine deaminase, partial [Bacteroidota bacterium]